MIQGLVLGFQFRVTVFGVKARVRVIVYGYGYGYGGSGLWFMVTVVSVWVINVLTACKPIGPNNSLKYWFKRPPPNQPS